MSFSTSTSLVAASVAMVEVLFAIEEEFDRTLPYEAEEAPATLGEFLTLIEARLS